MSHNRWSLPGVVLVCTAALLLGAAGCNKDGQKAGDDKAAAQAVNNTCPIMGTAINPAKVPADQTRPFKGQTVGFCCMNCPPVWDKLSDAQKQAKLDAVLKPSASQPQRP